MGEIPASVHYKPTKDPKVECGNCEFYSGTFCSMFDAYVNPAYVCDKWEAVKPPPPPPKAPSAAHHNRILKAGYKRADELEARMVRVLTPILTKAGRDAAKNFTATTTNHLAASARREDDCAALVGLAPAEARSLVASLALSAAAPSSTSAMVCLKPTPAQAAAIADPDGEPPEYLHVTLVSLGEIDGDLAPIADALRIVAGEHAPLSGTVAGYGQFGTPDGGAIGILLPDVPGLVELRVAVTQALVKAGIDYATDHGYEAHLTVDTTPEPDEADEMLTDTYGKPLTFSELLIVRGDVEVVAIPFTGALPLTAAAKPPAGTTPEELKARTQAVEDAKAALRTRLSDGSDTAAVEAAKADLRAAQSDLYAASAQNPVWSAPAPAEVLDVDALVLALRTKTEPVRVAMVTAMTKTSIEQAGVSFDVSNPYVSREIENTASQITNIAKTTLDNTTKIIQASYAQGLSIPDTAKAIRVGMQEQSVTRSILIARTTLSGATNGGSLAATQAIDAAVGGEGGLSKTWLVAPGAKYPRHELVDGLDGQTQTLDAPFDVDGESMMYPGDPSASPENCCACRCTMTYSSGETVSADDSE